jgi:aminopeptidase N
MEKSAKRKEYKRPDYLVEGKVSLEFSLDETATKVTAIYQMERTENTAEDAPLILYLGSEVELDCLFVGRWLNESEFVREGDVITVVKVPAKFLVEVVTIVNPKENTSLEGLYMSGSMFLTQCEAEGFRHITAYPDRPDVMASFAVTIVGDKTKYPVMLSNGNLVEKGDVEGTNNHYAAWDNPFKMPCYLFALVAGDLAVLKDAFTTMSGRIIDLALFAEKNDVESGKCDHAMTSLKLAMEFDERKYGRECDVGTYMVVATAHFNMGAMENKGLNIFNTKFVLASPETATDADYERVEGVVAHEYFHNWTGNRITCKNWLELGLKEGLTVFRDQQFSRERWGFRKVVQDISLMRNRQFKEDAGPLAHPVRPEEIEEVGNMYTPTVYRKGAEVYRMLHVMLGEEGFRKGTDLYFERHDGQAVGIDDLVQCMSDANAGIDLTQFMHWFSFAGTPTVGVVASYFPESKSLAMRVTQSCPPTPGQPEKPAFHIPFSIGFVGTSGDMAVTEESGAYDPKTGVLHITKSREIFVFSGVSEEPALSLNRGFAPVKMKYDYSEGELAFLMAHDLHFIARWDAGQTYASQILLGLAEERKAGRKLILNKQFAKAFGSIIKQRGIDKNLLAAMMTLPSESDLANQASIVNPGIIHAVREFVKRELGRVYGNVFSQLYASNQIFDEYPVSFEPEAVAKRAVANIALEYLLPSLSDEKDGAAHRFLGQFRQAKNMTDKFAALSLLVWEQGCSYRIRKIAARALDQFYDQYKDDGNVIDMWLSVQGMYPRVTVRDIKALMAHPAYDAGNPNRVRALIGGFALGNPAAFHHPSGEGYQFLSDFIIGYVEKNPLTAAMLVEPLTEWKRYEPKRSEIMKEELGYLKDKLSQADSTKVRGVMEKVSKALSE